MEIRGKNIFEHGVTCVRAFAAQMVPRKFIESGFFLLAGRVDCRTVGNYLLKLINNPIFNHSNIKDLKIKTSQMQNNFKQCHCL